jgi:hypothetical protein
VRTGVVTPGANVSFEGLGAHAANEQIYSSLVPRTHLCARLLETLD